MPVTTLAFPDVEIHQRATLARQQGHGKRLNGGRLQRGDSRRQARRILMGRIGLLATLHRDQKRSVAEGP
jgi:hypothetical protein